LCTARRSGSFFKGLGNEVIGPPLHGLHRNFDAAVGGHHDDGEPGVFLPQGLQKFKAVDLGHPDVQKDQVHGHLPHQAQGLRGPGSGGDFDFGEMLVADAGQAFQHVDFVLHDQDSFLGHRTLPRLRYGHLDGEPSPLARLTLRMDVAAMLLDNAVTDRQSQTGAFAGLFGAEKGVEDPVDDLHGNAGAVVP